MARPIHAASTIVACSPSIVGNVASVVASSSTTTVAVIVVSVPTITTAITFATAITATCTSKPCTYEPILSQQPIAPLSLQHIATMA